MTSSKTEEIKCTGNNDNGCFLHSPAINCGCEGLKEVIEIVTLKNIIKFKDALINLYETEREGTTKFNLFRDSYKSTIEELEESILKNRKE